MGRAQLLALGFDRSQITRDVARGRLHRLHRGVYAVGHRRLTVRGRWLAAVLACGSHAALSHRSAAALWDIGPMPSGPIDVAGPRSSRTTPGIRYHACRSGVTGERTCRDAIPVTTLPRTLLDLAEVIAPQRLRRVLEEAERRDLLDWRLLEATVEEHNGRRGTKPLRAVMAEVTGPAPWTQSELEEAFLRLIRAAGLPEPRLNVLVHDELIDCYWPEVPLAVELDGYWFHRGRRSFEDDRRRDAKLQLNGIPVLRFTQPRVEHEPAQVLNEVQTMISRRPAAAPSGWRTSARHRAGGSAPAAPPPR